MEVYFEVIGFLGKRIRVTLSHWDLITKRKHPEVKGLEQEVQMALIEPLCVRISQEDPDVHLYYAKFKKYFICVVCRHLNGDAFIITSYLTDKIKEGREVWRR